MNAETFEQAVRDALDELPDWALPYLENVAVLVADDAPGGEDLLGLYEGVPETERGHEEPFDPARITIFRNPLLRMTTDEADLRKEIRITVLHEIAHHFGISEKRLGELGYG